MKKIALEVNQRVELSPATDAWMQGDQFGHVTRIEQKSDTVYVKMDKSKRELAYASRYIMKKEVKGQFVYMEEV